MLQDGKSAALRNKLLSQHFSYFDIFCHQNLQFGEFSNIHLILNARTVKIIIFEDQNH